jgi:RNA recognition motif-containing protein
LDGKEYTQYQYGYILYDKVEEAQHAIKKFDNSSEFGGRPMKVELWQSKDEIEHDKK